MMMLSDYFGFGEMFTFFSGGQEEKDGEFMVNAMDVEELRRSQRR